MPAELGFDVAAAHGHFAAHGFNAPWRLTDEPSRTLDQRLIVALNQASSEHWQNRSDCTNGNRSVRYGQASRTQALLGNATAAARHAEVCARCGAGLELFAGGDACEALARAASRAVDRQRAAEYLCRRRGLESGS